MSRTSDADVAADRAADGAAVAGLARRPDRRRGAGVRSVRVRSAPAATAEATPTTAGAPHHADRGRGRDRDRVGAEPECHIITDRAMSAIRLPDDVPPVWPTLPLVGTEPIIGSEADSMAVIG
jgi:hypothetical protein